MRIDLKKIFTHEIAYVFYIIFLYKIIYYYLIGALFHFGWNIYLFDFDVKGFEGIYHNFSFFLASFNNLLVSLPLLIIYAFIYKFKDKFTWDEISSHQLFKPTKYFLIFVVAFTTWFYSFSAYNYYFDRLFLFDRLLLIFSFILLFRTPKILPLFILLSVLWVSQFSYPLGLNGINDKKIIFEMVVVFVSYLSINSIRRVNLNYIWLIIFSLIGTNYFIPAILKIFIAPNFFEWMTDNDLFVHFIGQLERDWLASFSYSFKSILVNFVIKFNNFILVFTIILEISAIFILYNRKLSIIMCVLFSLFHLGIFIESGIFFWKWIAFNLFLVFVLLKFKKEFSVIFNKRFFKISMILILFSPLFFNPVYLGWWDINFKHSFKYFVVNEDNDTLQISGNQFKPYNQIFTFQRLYKLIPDTLPFYQPNSLSYEEFIRFRDLEVNEVNMIIDENKEKYYDKDFYNLFDKFIYTYFENFNKKDKTYLDILSVFPHIWTSKYPNNKYDRKKKVKEFYSVLNIYYIRENKTSNFFKNRKNDLNNLNIIEDSFFDDKIEIILIDTIYSRKFVLDN